MTEVTWKRVGRFLGTGIVYGVLVIILGIGTILFVRSAFARYIDNPPVNVVSLDPVYLGETCPGDNLDVHNRVEIENPVIAIYYIGVMDQNTIYNILHTQMIYNGFQHPVPGIFTHTLPYNTPDIPAGNYIRAFAARGTNTEEKTVFITSTFTILASCSERQTHAKPSANYRIGQDGGSDWNSLVSPHGFLADDE